MKPIRVANPHDAFFKELFGRPEQIRGFLREYLPPRLYSRIDPQTLEVVKDSFVDKELSSHFSDLLYTVRLGKRKGFLYLLFEHKSHADPRVSFQLLRNMVKIWERYMQRNKRSKHLPPIVPLVIYHGARMWDNQEDFRRLFDVDADLERYIPRFEVEVYDLSHLPAEAIRGEVVMQAAVLLMGHIFRPDLSEKVPDVLRLLGGAADARSTKELIEVFIRYLLAASPAERQEKVTQTVVKTLREGDATMFSIADKLRAEGREEGREEGKKETIINADRQGLGVTQIAALTGFSVQKVRAILRGAKKG